MDKLRLGAFYVSPRTAWLLVAAGGVNAVIASAFVVIFRVVDTGWQPVVALVIGALLTYVQYMVSQTVAERRRR